MIGQSPDPIVLAARLIVVFVAIGIHEFAHCWFADLAGDPTPSYYGRVTLNLFKHFDPMGSILIIFTSIFGFGIGWGRPAPMDFRKMRNPRWDGFIAVAAGPISNLLQALIYGAVIRIGWNSAFMDRFASGDKVFEFIYFLCMFGVISNLALAFFNLIPLGVLDGHWLVGLLLPEKQRILWFRFQRQYGLILLIGLIFISQSQKISIIPWGYISNGYQLIAGRPIGS